MKLRLSFVVALLLVLFGRSSGVAAQASSMTWAVPDSLLSDGSACDRPDVPWWVSHMQGRVEAFDRLAGFGIAQFGAPLACHGDVTDAFDGMEFGWVTLSMARGASFTVQTFAPEASRAELRSPSGFEDEAEALAALREYTDAVGVAIDWNRYVWTETDDGEEHQIFVDPDDGLNASATRVYRDGRLIALRFSLAL